MLGELLRMARLGIAVAGTHGKTTTTSLIALIMEEADLDPTVAMGGNFASGQQCAPRSWRLYGGGGGRERRVILTADPTIAVVTNIDPEHLDHYGTMDKVRQAFADFINRVPFYGVAVLGIDNVNVRGLLASIRKPTVTYGVAPDADLRAEKIVIDGLSTRFEVVRKGENLGRVTIPTPGVHVAMNSLAAIAVAMEVGISFEVAAAALAKFGGISRRFEIKGEAAGRIVLDDYAHHPAEVRATLAAVRASFKRRVVAVSSRIGTLACAICSTISCRRSTMPTCFTCSRSIRPARSRLPRYLRAVCTRRCARVGISRCTTLATRKIAPRGSRRARAPAT